jgi:hypothetical protein
VDGATLLAEGSCEGSNVSKHKTGFGDEEWIQCVAPMAKIDGIER